MRLWDAAVGVCAENDGVDTAAAQHAQNRLGRIRAAVPFERYAYYRKLLKELKL